MTSREHIEPPDDLDWQYWVDCWDRMQERYLVKRTERFETIVRLVRETQRSVAGVLDLGCGTGSLMLPVLEAFPEAEVVGIDFDPIILWLAEARLARFGDRSHLLLADLRDASWTREVPSPLDAVVSATALHWVAPNQLADLYRRIAPLMRPGAIFLNADHVGSDCPEIQRAWESSREEARARQASERSEDWDTFWSEYARALGLDVREIHQRAIAGCDGAIEEGLPLAWHLDRLRESGFASVDCFWRTDCDAIYGGIRG
jgi:cyclopropane fatty-acyl-phospholipid synthase-like methyltransferase